MADLKALMRQTGRPTSSREAVREKAELLRRKKAADKEAAKEAALAEKQRQKDEAQKSMMPPPPPRMLPPATKKKVVSFSALKEQAAPAPIEAAPQSNPALPAGFFDTSGAAPSTTGALVADYGDDDDDDAAMTPAPVEEVEEVVPEGLPAGFFDDKDADLRARGVEPEKQKKEDDKAAWKEFQAFAGDLVQAEAVDDKAEELEASEELARRALEQAWYERKLGLLLRRADSKGAAVEEDPAASAPDELPRSLDDETTTTTLAPANDVAVFLQAKKRKRKEHLEVLKEEKFVPLAGDDSDSDDDSDDGAWRSKAI